MGCDRFWDCSPYAWALTSAGSNMAFRGQRVMLSRNLVPVDKYDMILEKLKQNEAEVIQCSNPGYNRKNDFHVLYSFNSVRIEAN